MADELVIATPRLELVAATPAVLAAELDGPKRLATALGAAIPADWPPQYFDREATDYSLAQLEAHPADTGWSMWYAVRHAADGTARTAVGVCGFKGAPDEHGVVEIGYSVVPSAQRLGYGTEMVQGLLTWAFADRRVGAVAAETLPELEGSRRLLARLGFAETGAGSEPDTLRYELPRGPAAG